MLPPENATAASERASGRAGPSAVHASKLPGPDTVDTNVVSVASPAALLPPMNSSCVPDWTTAPSTLGSGRWISCGASSHGIAAPTGAGHGSDSFSGGQKLIGLHARIPMSIVRLTTK